MREGEIPKEWREANITPLFKKGSRLIAENYRPVSLTSICCKLMEGIIRDRMMKFMEEANLISKSQHGFVKKRACVTNLLECQGLVANILSKGNSVDVLYTDFSKAFDKVSHRKLLVKLSGYGFSLKLISWIRAFLQDRKQCVVMGDIESDWREIWSGVPQGSVLGPLLFVVYINDLPECLSNKCKMYADDSKVFAEVNLNGQSNLQMDINSIVKWCKNWDMSLNCSKCKIMHFGSKNPRSI